MNIYACTHITFTYFYKIHSNYFSWKSIWGTQNCNNDNTLKLILIIDFIKEELQLALNSKKKKKNQPIECSNYGGIDGAKYIWQVGVTLRYDWISHSCFP